MSYEEILATSDDGRYRVKLVADEDATEPYDDGQSPLLRIELSSWGTLAEHIMATGRPLDDDNRIEEAAQSWGPPSSSNWPKFEKYLRAYYGTREIETWYSGNYWYVTYDTARWREYIGFEEDTETPHPLVNMTEYRAWCEGDCWGWVVERNVTWHRDDNPDATMQTWEHVDSCWGYYGRDGANGEYLKSCAMEALKDASEPEPGQISSASKTS